MVEEEQLLAHAVFLRVLVVIAESVPVTSKNCPDKGHTDILEIIVIAVIRSRTRVENGFVSEKVAIRMTLNHCEKIALAEAVHENGPDQWPQEFDDIAGIRRRVFLVPGYGNDFLKEGNTGEAPG